MQGVCVCVLICIRHGLIKINFSHSWILNIDGIILWCRLIESDGDVAMCILIFLVPHLSISINFAVIRLASFFFLLWNVFFSMLCPLINEQNEIVGRIRRVWWVGFKAHTYTMQAHSIPVWREKNRIATARTIYENMQIIHIHTNQAPSR